MTQKKAGQYILGMRHQVIVELVNHSSKQGCNSSIVKTRSTFDHRSGAFSGVKEDVGLACVIEKYDARGVI